MLNEQDVENIHFQLIKSGNIDINSSDEIAKSFREHLYAGLKFLLQEDRLQAANQKNFEIMLYIARRKQDGWLNLESLENFSCPALREIDALWYDYPNRPQHFGFRVQKEIWQKNVKSPIINLSDKEKILQFNIEVGWKTEESGSSWIDGSYVEYEKLGGFIDYEQSKRGNLPYMGVRAFWDGTVRIEDSGVGYLSIPNTEGMDDLQEALIFSRTANCNLLHITTD